MFWSPPTSRPYRLAIPGWTSSLQGTRIAVLADLHVGSPFNQLGKLRRIVGAVNEAKPDLILLAGDVVIQGVWGGKFTPPEEIALVLGDLRAPLGVWAVLGNHDWWLDAPRVRAALEKSGIRVVDDEAALIKSPAGSFWLAGISDFWEGRHDVAGTLRQVRGDAPVVMFTHNPDVFPMVSGRVSLLIAGHTHGGQVWVPFAGRPVVPSKYGQRYAAGHIIEDSRHLFVNTGVASIFPVRFLVPPEISMLELYAETAGPSRGSR